MLTIALLTEFEILGVDKMVNEITLFQTAKAPVNVHELRRNFTG